MRWMRALAVAALVAIAGCGDDDSDRAEADRGAGVPFRERVVITETGYHPADAKVLVGGTVTWVNRDPGKSHTAETDKGFKVTPSGEDGSFDTHTLTWGEPYTVTFHVPGSYSYSSSLDADFRGTVEVIMREPPRR